MGLTLIMCYSLCLGTDDRFGERQSRRICFLEFTYGECEWCGSRVFEVPLPSKQLQELNNNFLYTVFFFSKPLLIGYIAEYKTRNDM